jgi:ABC-2 type transport system permease protein
MTTNDAAAAVDTGPMISHDTLHNVLSTGERPERPTGIGAALTFGWRAMLRIKHVPEQLFDVTAFPIMMTLMFTYLFGGALAGSPQEYIQVLLPGILVMSVVMITMYTGIALNNDVKKGVFDRFRSLPIWRPAIIVGALLGDAVRYTIASIVIIGLGLIMGFRPGGGVAGVLLGVVLLLVFSFAVSWIWTLLSLILRTPESVLNVSMFVLFPITFGSNIFVAPETMPGWLQAFVDVNPVAHLVTAVRGAMGGTLDGGDLMWVLVSSAVLVAIFAPLTMYRFAKKS